MSSQILTHLPPRNLVQSIFRLLKNDAMQTFLNVIHISVAGCRPVTRQRILLTTFIFVFSLVGTKPCPADILNLKSFSLRANISDSSILGKDQTEKFDEYDVALHFELPWKHYSAKGWGIGTQLMTSAGMIKGSGERALIVSLIPELTLGSNDGRFSLIVGAGGALMSRQRFGTQDFGGPFQFALTAGFRLPLYKNLGIGYRFLHYSDASVNGSDTIGADLHMIEFSYLY